MNCVLRDQSLSDLLHSTKEKHATATEMAVVGQHLQVTVHCYALTS